jgi:hypothetical protein
MCASGLAGVLTPDDVGGALELIPTTPRGRTEVRAGLGGTYAALGAWALADRSPAAKRAVGFTWLGAGVVRLGSLVVDRPRTDVPFWAYLAVELGLGSAAVLEAGKGRVRA